MPTMPSFSSSKVPLRKLLRKLISAFLNSSEGEKLLDADFISLRKSVKYISISLEMIFLEARNSLRFISLSKINSDLMSLFSSSKLEMLCVNSFSFWSKVSLFDVSKRGRVQLMYFFTALSSKMNFCRKRSAIFSLISDE